MFTGLNIKNLVKFKKQYRGSDKDLCTRKLIESSFIMKKWEAI